MLALSIVYCYFSVIRNIFKINLKYKKSKLIHKFKGINLIKSYKKIIMNKFEKIELYQYI